jgi:hypothetical protein
MVFGAGTTSAQFVVRLFTNITAAIMGRKRGRRNAPRPATTIRKSRASAGGKARATGTETPCEFACSLVFLDAGFDACFDACDTCDAYSGGVSDVLDVDLDENEEKLLNLDTNLDENKREI